MENYEDEGMSTNGSDLAALFDEKEQSSSDKAWEKYDTKISEYMLKPMWTVGGLEELLKEGHDPNTCVLASIDHEDASLPLVIATEYQNLAAVKVLLKYGANVQKRDGNVRKRGKGLLSGNNALEEACFRGNLDILTEMFKYDIDKENCLFALRLAVEFNHLNIVRFLCEQEVNVNATNPFEKSPLFAAVERRSIDIITLLFEHGATDEDSDYMPLVEACKIGDLQIVKQLIEGGCSVNESQEQAHNWSCRRTTPLCSALKNNHEEIVKYLIEEQGANVNRLNTYEADCPMCIAAQMGDLQMVEYLYQHRAQVRDIGSIGDLTLECACMSQNAEVVKFMIDKGAVLDVRSNGLYIMIRDLKKTENVYEQILRLLLCENVLVFYEVPLAEQDGWEEFLSRFVDNCIANPDLFRWIIMAGCDRKILYKLRHFEFIKGLFAEHPYGNAWSAETEASNKQYFREIAQNLADREEVRSYVDDVIASPERLVDLCRRKIRNYLRTHITNKTSGLPLASFHKNFLLIPEM